MAAQHDTTQHCTTDCAAQRNTAQLNTAQHNTVTTARRVTTNPLHPRAGRVISFLSIAFFSVVGPLFYCPFFFILLVFFGCALCCYTQSLTLITSHYVTSHHITSHHTTSHHITSHHTTSHHLTSLHLSVQVKKAAQMTLAETAQVESGTLRLRRAEARLAQRGKEIENVMANLKAELDRKPNPVNNATGLHVHPGDHGKGPGAASASGAVGAVHALVPTSVE